MILFVFVGKKREPLLFKTLEYLFFSKKGSSIVCSFGNNIYALYKQLSEMGNDGDLVSVLRERFQEMEENPLRNVSKSSDFSEIYLFFDYDFHDKNISLSLINSQMREMLSYFDNETDNGKLYINYPMVESIRYTKKLPDVNYCKYVVQREKCCNFKNIVQKFSNYGSLDFILIDHRKPIKKEKEYCVRKNWQYLRKQNVLKANYICHEENLFPDNKDRIAQKIIFEAQLQKYVNTECCSVAILNAFPIFLYEYFK